VHNQTAHLFTYLTHQLNTASFVRMHKSFFDPSVFTHWLPTMQEDLQLNKTRRRMKGSEVCLIMTNNSLDKFF